MRVELSKYSNRHIKVVGTFIKQGIKKETQKTALIKDIINADTGEYLADHMWIDVPKEMRTLPLFEGEKIFFVGKVVKYKKGYYGHNVNKILSTKSPKTDYQLINIQNVIKENDVIKDTIYLEKLKYRKKYIEEKRDKDSIRKEELETLIRETENKKNQFKGNELLYIRPIRTIEPVLSNKYQNYPLLYTTIDIIKKYHVFKSFSERKKHFIKTYHQIKHYKENKEQIKIINKEIIDRYRESREIFKRKTTIETLINELERTINNIENRLNMTKNITWQPAHEETSEFEFQNAKQYRKIRKSS